MPTSSRLRQKQRDEIHPLIRALDARLGNARSYMDIARETGLTNYQVGRLLGESLPSPTYLDLTRLIVAAGMTPNEAARVVGLWNGPDYDREEAQRLTKEEQRVIDLLRQVKLPEEERNVFRAMMETMLEAFAERLALSNELKGQRNSPPSSPLYDEDETSDEVEEAEEAEETEKPRTRTRGRKPVTLKE